MVFTTLFPGVALVTGAGGVGIGAHVAAAFAQEGCSKIAITDINSSPLKETVDKIKEIDPEVSVHAVVGDITDTEFVESLVREVVAEFGRIDYAVNCAGVLGPNARSQDLDVSAFDAVNSVNYRGCWLSSRAEIKTMLSQDPLPSAGRRPPQRGAIVNIASGLGLIAVPGSAAYCASKAAVIGMTRADAIDCAKDDIRVNCVCPGITATSMTTSTTELVEAMTTMIDASPSGRWGLPEEIADAVLFLCSYKASFIKGHALVVDGGYTIT